jgi:ketosteroid isomerase-like protein
MKGKHFTAILMLAGMVLVYGCAGTKGVHDVRITYEALEETDMGRMKPMEHGSQTEQAAIERFREFYRVFSAERIAASVTDVYAEDAYFEDGIRQVKGRGKIREYFLSTTGAFDECTFDIKDVAYSPGNYYFRWIMHLKLKRDPDNPMEQPGMSHVRFDEQGRVVFHHDYWETLALFERFPVIGSVLRWIKGRI